MKANNQQWEIVKILARGGIGVLPTDTLYGVVGSAFSEKAVARLYRIRERDPRKPFIILIGSQSDLKRFGVTVDAPTQNILSRVWPGKVSVILPCPLKKFSYLHRGTGTLAFRLPRSLRIRTFLEKTGPLVAPSANLSGMPPAQTLREARKYFGDRVDFYLGAGKRRSGPASTLIAVQNGKIVVKRKP